jgi:hypothetical protein
MMITESNVAWVVQGIRAGTTRIDPLQTSVCWRPDVIPRSGDVELSSPDAMAAFIETMFFDPAVEGVKIVVLD